MVKPEVRKQAVTPMMTAHNLSERTACKLTSVCRTGYRYQRKVPHDDALQRRLKELAAKQVAYGYLFLHRLLKNEGLVVNKKRTYRLYTEERASGTDQETQKASPAETANDCVSRALSKMIDGFCF